MKNLIYIVLAYAVIIMLFSVGCKKDNDSSTYIEFKGKLTHATECKERGPVATVRDDLPSTLSCVEYVFDKDNYKLTLKHINAGFNCCPDSLYINTFLDNDTIVIKEYEADKLCKCECLYDLHIELNGIEAKKYTIMFVEPYALNLEQLLFDVNLENDEKGKFCVTRKKYPWGQ